MIAFSSGTKVWIAGGLTDMRCGMNSLALKVSYAGFWVTRPDQAARFAVSFAATPSVNVTPSMTKGNFCGCRP